MMSMLGYLYQELFTHGQIIPLTCVGIGAIYLRMVTRKVHYNKFRSLTPLVCALSGVILNITVPFVNAHYNGMLCCQIASGIWYGLAATGLCELVKHSKRFIQWCIVEDKCIISKTIKFIKSKLNRK